MWGCVRRRLHPVEACSVFKSYPLPTHLRELHKDHAENVQKKAPNRRLRRFSQALIAPQDTRNMRFHSLASWYEFLRTPNVEPLSSPYFQESFCCNMGSRAKNYGSQDPAGSSTAILGALGTLIGYVGTEITVNDLFERLLWPQRYYNGPSAHAVWKIALLIPMGGPLHKAALRTLDSFHKNGLFKGNRRGHMLGSAFFSDTGRSYHLHKGEASPTAEQVRNGIWVRVLDEMPVLLKDPVSKEPKDEDAIPLTRPVRQQVAVSHLHLARSVGVYTGPVISEDTRSFGIKAIGWLIVTETNGIVVALGVLLVWRSPFMLLWLLPLFLKLLSASFSILREDLTQHQTSNPKKDQRPNVKFEIIPKSNGFQIIEGEESVIVQFFRHYGHPVRSRGREILQITIVTMFGLLFPLGLLCSLLWMPPGMQIVWLSYQLYCTVALHIYHFAGGHHWATTEERICDSLRVAEAKHQDAHIQFGSDRNTAVYATLTRTSHDNFADGKAHVQRLLSASGCEKQESLNPSPALSRASSGTSSPTRALLPQPKPDAVVRVLPSPTAEPR